MKKNVYIIICIAFVVLTACGKNKTTISGKIVEPVVGEYLFLDEIKESNIITVDSIKLDETGKFSFQVNIRMPVFYILRLSEGNFFTLLAEPGDKIQLTANYGSLNEPVSVKGSAGTSKMIEYNKALKSTIEKLRGLYDIYSQNVGSPDIEKIIQTIDSTSKVYLSEINKYTKNFIDNNSGSLITLVALYQQIAPRQYVLDPIKDIKYFIKVDSTLFSKYPESGPVKALHEQVAALIESVMMSQANTPLLTIGSEAPEINLPSPEGKMISLSSTRGNIVLLDFWAAWCTPCRQENPNLVKAYEMYKDKGFQIFQVSLDRTREAWLKGIQEDNLENWIHVSDLKYWNSEVVPLYGIESIPHNLLLDREGKIIAMDLRGEQLHEKLAEVFK